MGLESNNDDFRPPEPIYRFILFFSRVEKVSQIQILKFSKKFVTWCYYNGSVLKNPEICGALYTLRIQYSYIQIQCEDGARDFRVL